MEERPFEAPSSRTSLRSERSISENNAPAVGAPPHALVAQIAPQWPSLSRHGDTLLVAVSGGADSVALLRAVVSLAAPEKPRVVAAHLNHCLRGSAADADAAFVASLCGLLGVPLESGTSNVARLADQQGDGLEAAARDARYEFLIDAARRTGARFILLAHTADDQAETILHRVLRGTGLNGLAGIPRRRALAPDLTLVRPLLGVRRAQVLDYLALLGQSFCDDETNTDRSFTRNRLRHDLLEQLRENYNPQVTEALLRVGSLASEAHEVVRQLVAELLPRCVAATSGDAMTIDGGALATRPRYLVRELLIAAWRAQGWPEQAMGFVEWELLAEMLVTPAAQLTTRQRMFPGCITVRRVADRLELSQRATARS